MTEPDGYRKPVEDLDTHSYWWLPSTANPDKEDGWESLYTPDTIIEIGSQIEKEIQEKQVESRYAYFKKRLLEELSEDKAGQTHEDDRV